MWNQGKELLSLGLKCEITWQETQLRKPFELELRYVNCIGFNFRHCASECFSYSLLVGALAIWYTACPSHVLKNFKASICFIFNISSHFQSTMTFFSMYHTNPILCYGVFRCKINDRLVWHLIHFGNLCADIFPHIYFLLFLIWLELRRGVSKSYSFFLL